jgi:toxin ParE1/3/4
MNIVFTKLALNDLKEIKKYIYENNQEVAKKVHAHIIERVETLLPQNPSIGRVGRVLRTRELVILKYSYIAPYQVNGDTIYILRILQTSRKWQE